MGLLSAVPPLISQLVMERVLWAHEGAWDRFLRFLPLFSNCLVWERALWAHEGAWDCFPRFLPSSLSWLWREPRGLMRAHGTAFCGSSPHLSVGYGESLMGS